MRFSVLIVLLSLSFLSLAANSTTTIIIDPGHGGQDTGAVYHGVKEATVNLKVAKLLNQLLISDQRFQPFLTRSKDKHVSLDQRAHFAREKEGEIFISLHSNSFNNKIAKGVEFYFQNQLPADEQAMLMASKENSKDSVVNSALWPLQPVKGHSRLKTEITNIIQDLQLNFRIRLSSLLAESLNQSWQGTRRSKRNSIKQAPFHVISNVSMPANLVELGYLSNKQEAQKLNSKKYQNKIAQSIYKGLIIYKESMDKPQVKDLD